MYDLRAKAFHITNPDLMHH